MKNLSDRAFEALMIVVIVLFSLSIGFLMRDVLYNQELVLIKTVDVDSNLIRHCLKYHAIDTVYIDLEEEKIDYYGRRENGEIIPFFTQGALNSFYNKQK